MWANIFFNYFYFLSLSLYTEISEFGDTKY